MLRPVARSHPYRTHRFWVWLTRTRQATHPTKGVRRTVASRVDQHTLLACPAPRGGGTDAPSLCWGQKMKGEKVETVMLVIILRLHARLACCVLGCRNTQPWLRRTLHQRRFADLQMTRKPPRLFGPQARARQAAIQPRRPVLYSI